MFPTLKRYSLLFMIVAVISLLDLGKGKCIIDSNMSTNFQITSLQWMCGIRWQCVEVIREATAVYNTL